LGEQIKKNVIIGIIIATFGGFVIIGQPLFALNLSDSIQGIIGNFLILASVISWTAYTIGSKELFSRYSYITITAFSFIVGMVALAPFSLYEYFKQPDWILNISGNTIIAIVFMVISSSIIAYLLYEWSIKLLSANLIGVVSHTQIIWAIVGSYIFLKELISIYFIFGALFILFGVYQTTRSLPHYHIHRGHKI
jgi:drug/metabolite transporter (DMT)-like permease